MKRTGILGGSFNPPHMGHLQIASQVYAEFGLDGVMLLPLGTPPHKSEIAAGAHREQMCRLMAETAEGLYVSTMELERSGYTYTVDTLRQLREVQPDLLPYYIIGTDTLFQLEHWKDHQTVLTLSEFICVPRPGDDTAAVQRKMAEFQAVYGKEILLCSSPGPDISSTQVREAVRQGCSTEGLLLPSVRAYIDEEGLYV